MDIQRQFFSQLSALIQSGHSSFHIAYSGGVDSQVLLHLSAELKNRYPHIEISAIHVNHGLSENATTWQHHCEQQCASLGLPLIVEKVEVNRQSGKGLEAAARDARYQALYSHCMPGSVLLLGQHANDQVETVLLQLKRGAGPKGLSGMAMVAENAQGITLVRPLLNVNRSEIEAYAAHGDLKWQDDESNLSREFDRNFLRHDVIPTLELRWPEFSKSVVRSARLCARQQSLIEEQCMARLADMETPEGGINITSLLAQSPAWRAEIIRYWLMTQNVDMPTEKILEQFTGLMLAREDANPVISWQAWQVRRFQGQMFVLKHTVPPDEQSIPMEHGKLIELGGERGYLSIESDCSDYQNHGDSEGVSNYLHIRYGGFSKRFRPHPEQMSKPLNQWFKLWHVPPWERETAPLIFVDDTLVAVFCNNRLFVDSTALTAVRSDITLSFRRS